jgi:hypothetical protein
VKRNQRHLVATIVAPHDAAPETRKVSLENLDRGPVGG